MMRVVMGCRVARLVAIHLDAIRLDTVVLADEGTRRTAGLDRSNCC